MDGISDCGVDRMVGISDCGVDRMVGISDCGLCLYANNNSSGRAVAISFRLILSSSSFTYPK